MDGIYVHAHTRVLTFACDTVCDASHFHSFGNLFLSGTVDSAHIGLTCTCSSSSQPSVSLHLLVHYCNKSSLKLHVIFLKNCTLFDELSSECTPHNEKITGALRTREVVGKYMHLLKNLVQYIKERKVSW